MINQSRLIITATITLLVVLCAFPINLAFGQANVESVIHFKRGKLWESFTQGNIGHTYRSFRRVDYAMDWPGFDYERVALSVGGPIAHHAGSGFCIGALSSDSDSILGVEQWGLFPEKTISESPDAKYRVKVHEKLYPNGENYWLQTNPNEAEETVRTVWEFNRDYSFGEEVRPLFLPVEVEREARAWNGSMRDENYIIIEYTITNTAKNDTTMHSTYLLFTRPFSINHRSLEILFPAVANLGNRDNVFTYDENRRMFYGWNGDFEGRAGDDTYDYWTQGGPNQNGEWLAPGFAGLRFLYISPNDSGVANHIHDYTWSAMDPTLATTPFSGASGYDMGQYEIIRNPSTAAYRPGREEEHFGEDRMFTLVTLGPYTLEPGDSIKVVTAEAIGGLSYKKAVDPNTPGFLVGTGLDSLEDAADRAQFNYEHGYNIPDPPPAPKFQLGRSEDAIGNVMSWSDSVEQVTDSDYQGAEAQDLAGYKIYRSNYLPIGPWNLIASIPKGSSTHYDAATRSYSYTDTSVAAGEGYYYAMTSYDSGHDQWPPDPSIGSVKPLESSLHANRIRDPFYAGTPGAETLNNVTVVPNPFVIESGFTMPRDSDVIQFIDIPGNCTIRIYSLQGNLVKTIHHNDGTGSAKWDQISNYGQFAESGVYIFHVIDNNTNAATKGKFAIVK